MPTLHRWNGRVYVTACVVGGLTGLILALGASSGPVTTLGFGSLAVAWLVSTILAWRRAALAIDDYRTAHGYDSREDAIGDRPSKGAQLREYQRVEREITRVGEERSRRKYGRER